MRWRPPEPSRGLRLHALFFATIRWTTLVYLENVGFQFLSLRHRPKWPRFSGPLTPSRNTVVGVIFARTLHLVAGPPGRFFL
jgi:hypothetical protein